MSQEQELKTAQKMILKWACSDLHHGVRAKPLTEALAQFTNDKEQAHLLKHYSHAFGWVVAIYDNGVKIHERDGRVESAEALLDQFISEAESAITTFGADKHGSFAPIK
jgi:hypothetical protein